MTHPVDKQLARSPRILGAGVCRRAFVIAEANRIFGPGGWSREIVELRNPANRERDGIHASAYVAKVRISVVLDAQTAIREAFGCGEGRGATPFEAHAAGLKAAETEATARALASFGRALGLEGFPRSRSPKSKTGESAEEPGEPAPHPAPPILKPHTSELHAAGPLNLSERASQHEDLVADFPGDRPLAGSGPLIPKVRRIRSPAHLGFVRDQPCLVCGRRPADAHHLRFIQPRAMAKKVSDEFTVPLCRRHHDLLHRDPDEPAWRRSMGIDSVAIAEELWAESRALA